MSLNSFVTLGHSGLRVSRLVMGAMTFGEETGFGSDAAQSHQVLSKYMELGGNFIDTANIYTKGHSEKIIGDYFAKEKGKRNRVVIASKFMGNLYAGDPNGGGAGRKAIFDQCHQSLRRLQTDYIDLYWLHAWDRLTPVEETMSALNDLVREGKIRYIGFSDVPAWKAAQTQVMAKANNWAPIIALQLEYSLLERTIEGEHVEMAAELGMGIIPWSPLKSGLLSGKFTKATPMSGVRSYFVGKVTDHQYAIIDEVVKIAKELDTKPAIVALAWVQQKSGVSGTLLGARTLEQLESNVKSMDLKLPESAIKRLDEISKPTLNFPYDFLGNTINLSQAGTTVNGIPSQITPMTPANDAERH
ncbi:aldo/keto reductase [Mucilaginibacter paludis]|nr:aldo/keto reductase [Mucilaginibacter paludis]